MAKTTKQQFNKSLERVIAKLETEVQACGLEGKARRLAQSKADFWYFFKHYLPHYSEQGTPDFHQEIISALRDAQGPLALAAPRGFAKSTLVSFTYVIWCILTQSKRFIVIISATDSLAADLSEFIRLELSDNERIKEDFGATLGYVGQKGNFTASQTRVLALGRRQALRGFRHRQHRPDLIILDDIEKDDEALSTNMPAKILASIQRGIIPSLDPQTGRLVFVGTILRTRSAAGIIMAGEGEPFNGWRRLIYKALNTAPDGSLYSLWPQRFALGKLLEIKQHIGTDAFNAEYQNMPLDDSTARFQPQWLTEAEDDGASPVAVFIDPSPDGIKNNDYKAAVFLAKLPERYVIIDAVLSQGADSKFFSAFIDAYKKHRQRIAHCGGEANGFQGYFLRQLQAAAQSEGLALPLRSVRAKQNKELRISRLAGYFEAGKLAFGAGAKASPWGRVLVQQLEYFPNSGAHDDGPDALEGALALWENSAHSARTLLPRKNRFFGFSQKAF